MTATGLETTTTEYENQNAQVIENNNSRDKESDRDVSEIFPNKDSCGEWLP